MGTLYKRAQDIKSVLPDEVLVEIGTSRGADGSTHFLNSVAQELGTVLYSVDIDDRWDILQYIPGVIGVEMPGSQWAQQAFPDLNKRIRVLYLDNFDWNWNGPDSGAEVFSQTQEYRDRYDIDLTNHNSQVEHLKQMMALLPYMSDDAIIICDDTLTLHDGTWTGKCGAVVVYLLAHGWKILEEENQPGSYSVMLGRSY